MARGPLLLLPPIALALLILASVEAEAQLEYSSQVLVLNIHNRERQEVGVPLLVWSQTLAAYAQMWANHLLEHGCTTVPSFGAYGENISRSSGGSSSLAYVVVESWVAERPHYNYDTNSCTQNHECHHYTQIVWGNTREVGCAQASCLLATGDTLTVCCYFPRGNVFGDRPF